MTVVRFGLRRMAPRDRTETHRATSPLELLFDLSFAVAVARAADTLHQRLADGAVGAPVLGYLLVFFAVYWAWLNFSWFASAFDTDDWLYRTMTVVQMGGVLVLAAGVPAALTSYDFTVATWGYVIMRLALVGQWVRAGVSDPGSRRTAFTYAIGVSIVQVLWLLRLLVPGLGWQLAAFAVVAAAELAVPTFAELHVGGTAWHPAHIADRYGCFTLILLGEGVLASATAVFQARGGAVHEAGLALIAACGLVIVAGLWWVYFRYDHADHVAGIAHGFVYGYAHYVIFAAAGAVSAGIALVVDAAGGKAVLPPHVAALILTVPVGAFLLATWFIVLRVHLSSVASTAVMVLSLAVVAAAGAAGATGVPGTMGVIVIVIVAALVAAVVAVLEVDRARRAMD